MLGKVIIRLCVLISYSHYLTTPLLTILLLPLIKPTVLCYFVKICLGNCQVKFTKEIDMYMYKPQGRFYMVQLTVIDEQ